MIIKPTRKKHKYKKLHCPKCGSEVPFERKYLNQLCQTKKMDKELYVVYIGYTCPVCIQVTNISFVNNKSFIKLFKKINLYGEY